MSEKLESALDCMLKIAAIMEVIAKAGKKVKSLCEED